jgi:hypothetical protein
VSFKLRRPCPRCPFRTDIEGYLRPERASEIGKDLERGSTFWCHETTVYDEDADEMTGGPESQFCAGALIMFERQRTANQSMRIGGRLGLYDPDKLDMSAPVVESVEELVLHHAGLDAPEYEPCEICDAGCEHPAGYMEGGTIVTETNGGPTSDCEGCGSYIVCESCECYCQREDDE